MLEDVRAQLDYLKRHIPTTRRIAEEFTARDRRGVRIAFSIHLDLKVVPVIEAVVRSGAEPFVLTCNRSATHGQMFHNTCPGCFLPHPPAPALRPRTSDVRRCCFPPNWR